MAKRGRSRIDATAIGGVGIVVDGPAKTTAVPTDAFGSRRGQATIKAIFKDDSGRKRGSARYDCQQSWP
jgi:hypothetical protein